MRSSAAVRVRQRGEVEDLVVDGDLVGRRRVDGAAEERRHRRRRHVAVDLGRHRGRDGERHQDQRDDEAPLGEEGEERPRHLLQPLAVGGGVDRQRAGDDRQVEVEHRGGDRHHEAPAQDDRDGGEAGRQPGEQRHAQEAPVDEAQRDAAPGRPPPRSPSSRATSALGGEVARQSACLGEGDRLLEAGAGSAGARRARRAASAHPSPANVVEARPLLPPRRGRSAHWYWLDQRLGRARRGRRRRHGAWRRRGRRARPQAPPRRPRRPRPPRPAAGAAPPAEKGIAVCIVTVGVPPSDCR